MSAVAAALFVVLLLKPATGTTANVRHLAAPDASLAASAEKGVDAVTYEGQSRNSRAVFAPFCRQAVITINLNEIALTYSYSQLLNQIIEKGVDSWEPREAGPYNKKTIDTRPLTSRELMNQLLEQIGSGPS